MARFELSIRLGRRGGL